MFTVLSLLFDGQFADGGFLQILDLDSMTLNDNFFGGVASADYTVYAALDDATANNLNSPNRIDTYTFADILAVAAPSGQGNGIVGGNYTTAGTVANPVVQFVGYNSNGSSGVAPITLLQPTTPGNTVVCVSYGYEGGGSANTGWNNVSTGFGGMNVVYQNVTTGSASAIIEPISFPVYPCFAAIYEIFNVPTTGNPIQALQAEYSNSTNFAINNLANPYTNTLTASGACLAITMTNQSSTPINSTIAPSGSPSNGEWEIDVNEEVWNAFGSIAWMNVSHAKFSGGTVQAITGFVNPAVGNFGASIPSVGIANTLLILVKLNN